MLLDRSNCWEIVLIICSFISSIVKIFNANSDNKVNFFLGKISHLVDLWFCISNANGVLVVYSDLFIGLCGPLINNNFVIVDLPHYIEFGGWCRPVGLVGV